MRCYFSEDALPREVTPLDNLFIMEYMPRATGTQLGVYLYGLMLCRYPAIDADIGEELMLKEQEVIDAFAYWQREGLVFIRGTDPLDVEYACANTKQPAILVPGKYASLVRAVQSLLSPRMLGAGELRRVYDWVEVFMLEESAVLELVSYCHERKGGRVSMNYMDAVARAWSEAGVRTLTDAREQINAHEALSNGARDILSRWSKSRAPTKDEMALYEKWTSEWGFSPEAIQAACPAAVNADKPTFAYLNGILERLRDAGALTEEAITALMLKESEDIARAKQVLSKMGLTQTPTAAKVAAIREYLQAGMALDALLYAAELAFEKERAFPYFKRVVQGYIDKGALTLDQAKAIEPPKTSAKEKRKPDSLNYPQRQFSKDSISHYYIKLDE